VETDLNGRIGFTAGAFRLRFGAAPESFIGQDVAGLIACPDRECFAASLSLMPERGRMTPTGLRLANPEQTPFVILGLHLALPGEAPRLCIPMGAVPIPLMVELTESAEIEDEAAAVTTIGALRERGIPVCLDDFGADAAAFCYLKAFRVDCVKVDGSFVAAIVDLSVAVGAKVVAEQIETAEYVQTMQALGEHLGQGWHFGRPGPLPEAAPIIAARRGGKQESWG
jgi:hypothetical protein